MAEWDRAALRQTLEQRFDFDELKDAALDLEMDYDGLDKDDLVRGLILHLAKRNDLDRLVDWIKQHRPDIDTASLARKAEPDQPAPDVPAGAPVESRVGGAPVADSSLAADDPPERQGSGARGALPSDMTVDIGSEAPTVVAPVAPSSPVAAPALRQAPDNTTAARVEKIGLWAGVAFIFWFTASVFGLEVNTTLAGGGAGDTGFAVGTIIGLVFAVLIWRRVPSSLSRSQLRSVLMMILAVSFGSALIGAIVAGSLGSTWVAVSVLLLISLGAGWLIWRVSGETAGPG